MVAENLSVKTLDDFAGKLSGQKVLVRVDFNVPLDPKTGEITDDRRIKAALPTIKRLVEEGAVPVCMSHLGRPKGTVQPQFSLRPVAGRLGELLNSEVTFAPDCVGPEAESAVEAAGPGAVVLLENLRFHKGETKNDPEFAAQLARHGTFYVNDAFGTCHRAHASVAGVVPHFKGKAAAGFLLQRELEIIGGALKNPKHPFVAILGGAKISGKIDVIRNLLQLVDTLLIGGGMAYTFFKAMGLEIGNSLLEEEKVEVAAQILGEVKERPGLKFYLPMDCVVAPEAKEGVSTKVVPRDGIPGDWEGLDIGPETQRLYSQIAEEAELVVWNGPMGLFEIKPFDEGTNAVAQALARATEKGAVTIVGGGDSALAIERAGLAEKVTHVSTGGGASLDLLAGKELPAVKALQEAQ